MAPFKNLVALWIAFRLCPVLVVLLACTWFFLPFAVASLFFPADVLGFQDWMQGQPVRQLFTPQSLRVGFGMACIALAVLALVQLNITTLIYRRVNKFATFWPAAFVLFGGLANAIWWLKTGYFDFTGAVMGCMPALSAIAWQSVCDRLGGRFVFGPGRI